MNKNCLHCAQPGPVSIIGQARHRTLIKLGIAGKRTLAGKLIKSHSQSENETKILSTFVKQRTYPWLSPANRERQSQTAGRGGTLLTLLTLLTHRFSEVVSRKQSSLWALKGLEGGPFLFSRPRTYPAGDALRG
jgi:hypothetical protein